MKQNKLLFKLILIAVFAALAFVATYISIPLPAGKVHLGNFVCILAGLLCGGIVGGVSGSLGMGLNDIVAGYAYPSVLRTFILKFFMGFLVGLFFRYLIKNKKNSFKGLLLLTIIFFILFVIALWTYIVTQGEFSVTIFSVTKKVSMHILVPIFLGLFFVFLLAALILSAKKSHFMQAVLLATVTATLFNIVGEFVLRVVLNISFLGGFDVAFATAITKIPSTVITGFVTAVIIMFIYYPIYKATKNLNFINDLELEEQDNSSEIEE